MTKLIEDPLNIAIAILADDGGQTFVNQAIKFGLAGGLVTPSTGLIRSEVLKKLGIHHRRKDMVVLFDRKSKLIPIVEQLAQKFKVKKPNHGVIFLLEAQHAITSFAEYHENDFKNIDTPYQLIWFTFNHGHHLEIVELFETLGHSGATFFTGRSEFVNERQKFLGLQVAPQKDTLLSLIGRENITDIFNALEEQFHIERTRGMKLISFDALAFSKSTDPTKIEASQHDLAMLVSVVSEDLQEDYQQLGKECGLSGGTSLNGFGSLNKDSIEKLFNISLSPQKKILFTVDTLDKVTGAYQAILNDSNLSAPHQGIYFILPVTKSFGIYSSDN